MEYAMISKTDQSHFNHTRSADSQEGLRGKMYRPIKVVMLGAGSGFTPKLMNDVLKIPGNRGGEIALVDIDTERLFTMEKVIRKLVEANGQEKKWKVSASTRREDILGNADYIVNCIEVSGVDCVRFDNDIPLEYGVDQCIGDTIGPGGLFKGLRTIPVFLDILKDCEIFCPDALVLNYTNPMSLMCLSAGRAGNMQVVGLCHSVQGTSHLLAKRAGVPIEEMTWECAGINHLAWFTKLEHEGNDLYPLLMEKAGEDIAGNPSNPDDAEDLVRKDLMLNFGAFVSESSGHLSEYLPYYRKRKDLIKKYCRSKYNGESGFYAREWPIWRSEADERRGKMLDGSESIEWDRSWEYASWIIEAREKDAPYRIHGNVMNNHKGAGPLIENLPADSCVEVACMVDGNGIQPTAYGKLPPQMAALCRSHTGFYDLAAQAVIERSREAAIQALMLDPLTSAVCSPSEIREMTIRLFEAEIEYLPDYS
jgi:alpha-galactosidase